MRSIDARMIKGLPDPQSPEAMDWMRETLQALMEREPETLDLTEIHQRLSALEGRAIPSPFDPSDILARLAALEARPLFAPPAQSVTRDPLDPTSWDSLDVALAALQVLITREAARRVGHDVTLYERMVYLDALGRARSDDQNVELLQHHDWAQARAAVELARQQHLSAIRKLTTLAAALAYDLSAYWPEDPT